MTNLAVTKYGTKLTEGELEYRKEIISESKSVFCPVTHEILSINDGEIMFINGKDYFMSTKGVERLEEIFGKEYIEGKVITYD